MPNMSYCRFQNTLSDLRECLEAMGNCSDLDEDEKEARERMIKICVEIALDFGDEVGLRVEEAE